LYLKELYQKMNDSFRKNVERERALERPLEVFSQKLWPWPIAKLIKLVFILAALDYVSTYTFLTVSNNPNLVEGGRLAGWALQTGGFFKLLLVDAAAVGGLVILAVGLRAWLSRLGYQGFGRTALVFMLVPYLVVILAVVFNNVFLALM
jgi:hypothetical protein